MPTTRQSRSKSRASQSRRSSINRAKRRPTWPKATSPRSARMHADGGEEFPDERERRLEILRVGAEANPQVSIHVEEVAGHQEHAAFLAQALGQLGRSHRMLMLHEDDRAGFRGDVAEPLLPLDPPPHQRIVGADDAARARDEDLALLRRERDPRYTIVDAAGRDGGVVVHAPELGDQRRWSNDPSNPQPRQAVSLRQPARDNGALVPSPHRRGVLGVTLRAAIDL